jgi:hypothetical protein
MFLKISRYSGLETVAATDAAGRPVKAVKFRRLPATPGLETTVQGTDRVDVMAETRWREAGRYWRIADANTELEAHHHTRPVGRTIQVPET